MKKGLIHLSLANHYYYYYIITFNKFVVILDALKMFEIKNM
jgi:hypothetical protein